jgi:hypothetical protein
LTLTSLHTKKPREKSGPRTSSRFQFQANFSILKILDLHETGNDYRVLFDHFDDLTILNSSDVPTRIQFYQVKGRDSGKHWTIKQLVKEEQAGIPPRSIIGKMYANVSSFPAEVERTAFASNACYSFLLADGTKTTPDHGTIIGAQLHASELQAIDAILEPDFPSPRSPNLAGVLLFERTNLPLQQQATFVTGRLAEHLAEYAGEEGFAIKALYEVLLQNVMARVGNTEEPSSLEKLHKNKSFSRAEISALIARVGAKRNFESSWPIIMGELQSASYSSVQIIRIQNASLRYLRERARGDILPNRLSEEIKAVAETHSVAISSCDCMIDRAALLRENIGMAHSYRDDELFGALLVEAYEALDAAS